jgi:hypothetical protein
MSFLIIHVFYVTQAAREVLCIAHTKVKQETNVLYGFMRLF